MHAQEFGGENKVNVTILTNLARNLRKGREIEIKVLIDKIKHKRY